MVMHSFFLVFDINHVPYKRKLAFKLYPTEFIIHPNVADWNVAADFYKRFREMLSNQLYLLVSMQKMFMAICLKKNAGIPKIFIHRFLGNWLKRFNL